MKRRLGAWSARAHAPPATHNRHPAVLPLMRRGCSGAVARIFKEPLAPACCCPPGRCSCRGRGACLCGGTGWRSEAPRPFLFRPAGEPPMLTSKKTLFVTCGGHVGNDWRYTCEQANGEEHMYAAAVSLVTLGPASTAASAARKTGTRRDVIKKQKRETPRILPRHTQGFHAGQGVSMAPLDCA